MNNMYERIKNMSLEEMKQFVYWVYSCGNMDGWDKCGDSPSGYFGGYMLTLPADEIMPNDATDDLWNTFDELYNKDKKI